MLSCVNNSGQLSVTLLVGEDPGLVEDRDPGAAAGTGRVTSGKWHRVLKSGSASKNVGLFFLKVSIYLI